MNKICSEKECVACQLCRVLCPRNAISFIINERGNETPQIDATKCIKCKKCLSICPTNNLSNVNFARPYIAYAAWSKDGNIRKRAASGGVASSIQASCLKKGIVTYGVKGNFGKSYKFSRMDNCIDNKKTMNSKYVYSDMSEIIVDIKEHLDTGKEVLFIGTPCQVAAIKSSYGGYDNLLLIDLICHGMPPTQYYIEHCEYLKKKYTNIIVDEIRFRTNNNYDWVLLNNEKRVVTISRFKDLYAVGFHGGTIYRECCYSCKFARAERVSDITIGDFWGLENVPEYKEEMPKGITAVLVNTEKGENILRKLGDGIIFKERTPEEVINNNGQLKAPPSNSLIREKFLKLYCKYGFEIAARRSFKLLACKQYLNANSYIVYIKKIIRSILK